MSDDDEPVPDSAVFAAAGIALAFMLMLFAILWRAV